MMQPVCREKLQVAMRLHHEKVKDTSGLAAISK
jgi:hypothetical protein